MHKITIDNQSKKLEWYQYIVHTMKLLHACGFKLFIRQNASTRLNYRLRLDKYKKKLNETKKQSEFHSMLNLRFFTPDSFRKCFA